MFIVPHYFKFHTETIKVQMRKTFVVLLESPLRVRKITIILISSLVLELLRSKDLKNYQKWYKNVQSLIKSFKINKICDIM